MSWSDIPDAQNPNWSGVSYDVTTAFQANAFQLPGFQIGTPITNVWGPINTYENPDWVPVAA